MADRETRGHRFLAPGPHTVAAADDLVSVVKGAYVVPTQEARETVIRKGVAAIEAATGFTADLPAKTLTEVINLSEYPTPMVGTFDEEFLKVPEEIIVDAMLMHQRYFPLYDADGKLTNKFIIVSNGDPAHEATIVDGNERVVAARLYDAKFFYDEDLKLPLDAYVDRLDEVVFQEALGTMRDKTARVVKLSARITSAAGIEAAEMRDIARSAYLAKADLVTSAVIEFTSVQGIMGSYYATAAGEPPRVARAIAEHYRPRFSGDAIPTDIIGQVVALSDKIDTICGLFAVGQAPTGSSDPFALRRAALGVLAILEETGLPISLVETIDGSLIIYREAGLQFDNAEVRREIIDFFITREKVALRDAGVKADTIDAVLACGIEEPIVLARRARALEAARTENPQVFDDLATAFARANNLREIGLGTGYKKAELTAVETALAEAVATAEGDVAAALADDRYADALVALAALRAPVDEFFDTTMVMDEDPEVRANRLKLLEPLRQRLRPRGRLLPDGEEIMHNKTPAERAARVPTIHIISDSIGETAQVVARAAAAQFGVTSPHLEIFSKVKSFEEVRGYLLEHARHHEEVLGDDRMLVMYTLVNADIREPLQGFLVEHPNIVAVDVLTAAVAAVSEMSGMEPVGKPGMLRVVDHNYFKRIGALEFTIAHDDGQNPEDLTKADIVLLGVSRSSKTPLSIYLAQQGLRVANVPLDPTTEPPSQIYDVDRTRLRSSKTPLSIYLAQQGLRVANVPLDPTTEPPSQIYDVDRTRLFGLMITPEVLLDIRRKRIKKAAGKAGGGQFAMLAKNYADPEYIYRDLEASRALMRRLGCIVVHTEGRAVEETAQEILRYYERSHPSNTDIID